MEEEEQEGIEEGQLVPQLEIWQVLKKPVHLRTPAERIAADDWARIRPGAWSGPGQVPGPDQDPFQAGLFD